jgi:hypothetical protein
MSLFEPETDEEYLKQSEMHKEILKKWTNLLIDSNISFKLLEWGSGSGITIEVDGSIITQDDLIHYPINIEIRDNGYISFSVDEDLEKYIMKRNKE